MEDPPQINDKCDVKWREGLQTLPAIILERRPLRTKRRKLTDTIKNKQSVDGLASNEMEYYVHYIDHDRRLDEWVTLDKLVLETLERNALPNAPLPTPAHQQPQQQSSSAPRPSTVRRRNSTNGSKKSTSTALTSSSSSAAAAASNDSALVLSGGNWHGVSGDPSMADYEREHEETTKLKNIESIIMGDWQVEAWYYSPFPDEYSDLQTLYVCEYCLTYMKYVKTYKKHKAECNCRHPPGTCIYKEEEIVVYEVDGKDHRAYSQKLCLLAKLFLDHKTLFYDVLPFRFYVVCKVDSRGAHIVGYFSKEKHSSEGYNLACILTFPQYQKSGYGKFIISLSYELTKREGTTGSPEKPLSDLGKLSYRSYWTHVLMNLLHEHDTKNDISINDISTRTGIRAEDIISTLQSLDMIKVWKGQHVVYVQQEVVGSYIKQSKPLRLCKGEYLTWEPPADTGAAGSSSKDGKS